MFHDMTRSKTEKLFNVIENFMVFCWVFFLRKGNIGIKKNLPDLLGMVFLTNLNGVCKY